MAAVKRRYEDRARQVLRAIEISGEITRASSASMRARDLALKVLERHAELLRIATPRFRNLRSLALLEEVILARWNEEVGVDVERFWARVAEEGLDFTRKRRRSRAKRPNATPKTRRRT